MKTNLFYCPKADTYRTSRNYDTEDVAKKSSDVIPDAGWVYIGTINAGVFPMQTNFKITFPH